MIRFSAIVFGMFYSWLSSTRPHALWLKHDWFERALLSLSAGEELVLSVPNVPSSELRFLLLSDCLDSG